MKDAWIRNRLAARFLTQQHPAAIIGRIPMHHADGRAGTGEIAFVARYGTQSIQAPVVLCRWAASRFPLLLKSLQALEFIEVTNHHHDATGNFWPHNYAIFTQCPRKVGAMAAKLCNFQWPDI